MTDKLADNAVDGWRETLEALYRSESRRVLATLIRLLGNFDLAEEALQDAFTAALTQWPRTGLPDNPRTWLISAGRFKTISTLSSPVRVKRLYFRYANGKQIIVMEEPCQE